MSKHMTRFSLLERVEHVGVMTVFLVLSFTGLPQKFFQATVSRWVITLVGGIDRVRWFHRAAGLVFTALVVLHLWRVISGLLTRRLTLSLVPTRQDFTDAITTLRYYLGLSDQQARFDRFDYRQKFEYWGLVFGAVVVIVTGLILYFPILTTRVLPGEIIPAAKVAHGSEGLMAFLVVITWHIYNAHLSPDVFPFDTTIFTGKISTERMQHEHPLEFERRVDHGATPEEGDG